MQPGTAQNTTMKNRGKHFQWVQVLKYPNQICQQAYLSNKLTNLHFAIVQGVHFWKKQLKSVTPVHEIPF